MVVQLLDFFVWCCSARSRCFGSFLFRVAFATPLVERFAFNGSGNSVVGPFSLGQCSTQIYVSFVMFLTVKSSREQALTHRWHLSTSCHGFGKGEIPFCLNLPFLLTIWAVCLGIWNHFYTVPNNTVLRSHHLAMKTRFF